VPSPDPAAAPLATPARSQTATRAAIAGLAHALPPQVVDNEPIAAHLGVEPSWIVQRTGISSRRRMAEGDRLSDLAAEAGAGALDAAGVPAADLDALLLATMSADQLLPHAGPLAAQDLGADRAMVWDIGLACTGFLAGLQQGAALIESGRAETVLLIGAEALSRHTDHDDKRTAALFGDGAGAMLLRADGPHRIGTVVLGADGSGGEVLWAEHADGLIQMDGQVVFRHAVARMQEACEAALAADGLALDDIDLVVPHQANGRIIGALRERLDLPPERVADYVAEVGNTSAASIPLALSLAEMDGRLPERGRVLVAAFGAGFAWGAAVLEWGEAA
jgi:3-oxoacyl-[acyl-carrier-protein] synthase III